MWIRSRLDIDWSDLFAGLTYCYSFRTRHSAVASVMSAWGSQRNALVTLSLRSSFDLFLRALNLPADSEILLSAITVPWMIAIVKHHRLIPVPVDVDQQGNLCLDSLESAVRKKSRVLVVAQLWGDRKPLAEIKRVTDAHGILLVEDCAQSFSGLGQSLGSESDVVMYSFGPIKTATALGGGITIVRSDELHTLMMGHLKRDPLQRRWRFGKRVVRFAILKLLSTRRLSQFLFTFLANRNLDPDRVLGGVAAGFSPNDLVKQIRHQPSTPLLCLMARRLRTYDFSRIKRRTLIGRQLCHLLSQPASDSSTFWAFPYVPFCRNGRGQAEVIARARTRGFDATAQTRLTLVPSVDGRGTPIANRWWPTAVFLPCYPELLDSEVPRLAGSVLSE